MRILMIAPTRADLPAVAKEAAAVASSHQVELLQGDDVRESDVAKAAADGGFDVIWFATHLAQDEAGGCLLLSREVLGIGAVAAYVAASGARLAIFNTCASIELAVQVLDDTPADVIATVSAAPDREAMRTGLLFARLLALCGDFRAAYERAKPGRNRQYVYLENVRTHSVRSDEAGMTMMARAEPTNQMQDRLLTTMDEMRKELGRVGTDVEVLKSKVTSIETKQDRMDARLQEIERRLSLPGRVEWDTWLVLIISGLLAVVLMISVFTLARGG
jgi:hypothetical protein